MAIHPSCLFIICNLPFMRTILAITLSILVFSCQPESNQKKAEKAVTEHLKTVLNDPKSYEPVKFDSLRNDSTKIEEDKEYRLADNGYRLYKKLLDNLNDESKFSTNSDDLKVNIEFMKKYLDSMKVFNSRIDSISRSFKPQFIGYSLHHSYRAKNKLNALVLEDNTFYLDSLIKVK